MADTRQRSGSFRGSLASGPTSGSGSSSSIPASVAGAGQTDYWTHHDIDYSWRFPYPEKRQKEYFAAPAYLDEDVRRRAGARPPPLVVEVWRSRERMRTQCVALVACLNIGVDPPDVVKPSPCARLQCWVDPESMLPAKALKAIGDRLQLQYERWHERAKYKPLLDPTAEELRKALISLRRAAGEERVMMHYNGHGVPKPTTNGEIWVYNKGYTQYLPVSLYDLQSWMGGVSAPSIYLFDCGHAGIIVHAFQHFMAQRRDKMTLKLKQQQQQQQQQRQANNNNNSPPSKNNGASAGSDDVVDGIDAAAIAASLTDPCRHIILAACSSTESLPLSPDLPADLFTSLLTTPIKMALRWFASRSQLNTATDLSAPSSASANRARLYSLIDKFPGLTKPNNRKLPFGELNWIFTAITDSIAWNILPRHLFAKLFRQDLLVSSLFRNFLLAQRVMATHGCTVQSVPSIAQTHLHPLWACWDLSCDIALSQLDRLEKHGTPFTPSTFFEEQLTSFEIWLDSPLNQPGPGGGCRPPPMQLPVVLQVLLSTDHRLRALQLLARFMDKGAWAINLALSVGIFPYVLKLLQSPSKDLREVLVFIWAKIFALDRGVAQDLSKIEYASYFIQHLLRYAPAQSLPSDGHAPGTGRSIHSRSSSVVPSPMLRPSMSPSSTPALTPFHHTFTLGSGSNSGAATPRIGPAPEQVQQFPFKFNSSSTSSQQPQPHGSATGTANTSPLLGDAHRSNPPPLDLPPSTSIVDMAHMGGDGTHSAHLRDHPPTAILHMRAQHLHDPTVPLDSVPADTPFELLADAEAPLGQPSREPSPGSRVPYPLDLNTHISPHHSPRNGNVSMTLMQSAKPSPVLGGVAFNPTSPMLSPQVAGPSFAGQQRFEDKAPPPSTDPLSDAHDLTRLARASLATTSLQHLLTLFILSCLAHSNPKGQQTLMQSGLSSFKELVAPRLIFSDDARLRQWTCLTIGKCWHGFGHAKTTAASEGIPETLVQMLMDPLPSVRCAALWALGAFFGGKILPPTTTSTPSTPGTPPQPTRSLAQRAQARLELEIHLGAAMSTLINDGSPLVRRELMLALAELIYFQQDLFLAIATAHPRNRESISVQGWYIWRAILRGCRDCSTQVSEAALAIKGYLKGRAILNQSQLGRMIGSQHNPGLHLHAHRDHQAMPYENIEEENMDDVGDLLSPASRRQSTAHRNSISRDAPPPQQSIAHIDADDISAQDEDSMPHDYHDRETAPHAPRNAAQQAISGRAVHFTRFKMGHLRPGAGGPGVGGGGGALPPHAGPAGSGGQRRSVDKAHVLKSMEAPSDATTNGDAPAATSTGTLDERAADQMWTVPKSRVFEDAYAAFAEPMLQATAADLAAQHLPSMSEIRHTKWRHARIQAIQSHARELRTTHPAKTSYVEVAFLNAEWEGTTCVAFHPYENMLLASDIHRSIGVWNYSSDEERGRERLNLFSNDNPPGTKITQLEVVNDASVSLLLVATDEGVVRLWRGVHEEGRQQLVTAWVANPQPEVFYNTNNAPMPAVTHVPPTPTRLDDHVITPSHSYQEAGFTSSSQVAQARLSGRLSTGVGMPTTPSPGMRHSASTPALASSTAPPSTSSRNGSLISHSGSLLPPTHTGSLSVQRSPVLKPTTPNMQPSSSAMNIPSYSLGGPAVPQTPQRHSPSISPMPTPVAASRRKQRPPLIVEWQQNRGQLLASGNGLEYLRIWDVCQEQCVSEIPIFGHESFEPHAPTYVTSMSTNGGDLAWLGCADGALRHFDLRLSPIDSLVSTARLHRSPVHTVRLQRHGRDGGMLISASVGGDIALADIRMADSSVIRYHRSSHKDKSSSLSAFSVHDASAICASGSHKPFIEIFDHTGLNLDTVKYHVGFLGQRIGPINALAFHRHKLLLAAGALDQYISIFAGEKNW